MDCIFIGSENSIITNKLPRVEQIYLKKNMIDTNTIVIYKRHIIYTKFTNKRPEKVDTKNNPHDLHYYTQ